MSPVRFSPQIQAESQGAAILIAGDTEFIGYYLSQFFLQQGCRVIFWKDFSGQEIERIDYIFCLSEEKKEKIEALLKISEKFGAKFLLAISKDEPLSFDPQEIFRKREVDVRVVELDYVYGPRMDHDLYREIVQLIKVVKIKPFFVSDVVYGLTKAIFTGGTAGKIFSLNEQTIFDWQPQIDSEEGLRQTGVWFEKTKSSTEERDSQLSKEWEPDKEKRKKKKKKFFLSSPNFSIFFLLFLLIIVLSYPFYSLVLDIFWGTRSLKKAIEISSSDFSKTSGHARRAEKVFSRAQTKLFFLAPLAGFLNQESLAYRVERRLNLGEKTARGMVCFSRAGEKTLLLGERILHGKEISVEGLIGEIGQALDCAYQQLSLAEGLIASDLEIGLKVKSLGFIQSLDQLSEKLPEVRELILLAKKGLQLVPNLTGLYGRKTYLVLLQNNMELRPTGGFIGAYALLVFDQGRLVDFNVENVYSADGQLKGHVEPPPLLKEYLGEAGWYLRDSNWHPDYPTSARRAIWFLEKETGRKVDGVFGINLFLVQKLLDSMGGNRSNGLSGKD